MEENTDISEEDIQALLRHGEVIVHVIPPKANRQAKTVIQLNLPMDTDLREEHFADYMDAPERAKALQ